MLVPEMRLRKATKATHVWCRWISRLRRHNSFVRLGHSFLFASQPWYSLKSNDSTFESVLILTKKTSLEVWFRQNGGQGRPPRQPLLGSENGATYRLWRTTRVYQSWPALVTIKSAQRNSFIHYPLHITCLFHVLMPLPGRCLVAALRNRVLLLETPRLQNHLNQFKLWNLIHGLK